MVVKPFSDLRSVRFNEFSRNVATLTYGIALAQVIAILLQPLLRRLYTPADFGAFAILLGLVEILVSMGTLRYETAVVPARHDREAMNLVALAVYVSVVFNICILILFLLFSESIAGLIGFPVRYKYWLFLIPVLVLLYNATEAANYWLTRKKAFRASSVNKISRRAVEGIVQVSSGFANYSPGLVFGALFGQLANIGAALYQLPASGFRSARIGVVHLKYVMRKYREFPLFATVPSTLNVLSLLLPVFMVNRLFTNADTGYFDLSRQLLIVPMALIAASISQVLFQKLSEKKNNNQSVAHIVYKIFGILFLASAVGVAILWFWAEPLFAFIFGDEWRTSGEITRILAFGFAMKFVVSSISITLISLGKIRWMSVWQVFYFLIIFGLIMFSYRDIFDFCLFYTMFEVFSFLLLLGLIGLSIRGYERSRPLNESNRV